MSLPYYYQSYIDCIEYDIFIFILFDNNVTLTDIYMYFMPDALVSISWLLPDYSIFGPFICFRVPNYVFSKI